MWANKVSSCWKSVCRVRFHVARCCPLSRCVCLRPGLIWLESVTLCNLWPFDLKERKHFRGIMTLQITDVKKLIFTPVIFMIIARHNYGLSCFSWEPWPGCPDLRGGQSRDPGPWDAGTRSVERWGGGEREGGKGAEELGASLGILPPGRTITPTTRHQLQNIVHICLMVNCILFTMLWAEGKL